MNLDQRQLCKQARHAVALAIFAASLGLWRTALTAETIFSVTIDRGADIGQAFGSLFEAESLDGDVVIGAGFQNAYNTRYRADRHAVQFFVRPASGQRELLSTALPRPNDLCGTYLYGRDGVIRSTYGGVRAWYGDDGAWRAEPEFGGTEESVRIGDKLLEFGDSQVRYDGRTILGPPKRGSYQLFFYANGHLCFYHVVRGDAGYRPYVNDEDGFSKLYACPWTAELDAVDLSKAATFNLPVVGETTFAWGQLGRQIVTGSNIGGFYVFEAGQWQMLLAPQIGVSYQLYSTMAVENRLLMGQYPTGRLFAYDGQQIMDLAGWPPNLPGVSSSAREAQTTTIYGGEVLVGVWPWAELWRYHPDRKEWALMRRMFDHPQTSDQVVHPYDVENEGHAVGNLWGQRITSLVPSGADLYLSTSAKSPVPWEPAKFPFLAPNKWRSYGAVYRLTAAGHLGAPLRWTEGPTTIEFTIRGAQFSISQDGRLLAETSVAGELAEQLAGLQGIAKPRWGEGIYGPFGGAAIQGAIKRR